MQSWQLALFAAVTASLATAIGFWAVYRTSTAASVLLAARTAGLRPGQLPAEAVATIHSIIDTQETGGVRIGRTFADTNLWLAELHSARRPGARSWQKPGRLWVAISRSTSVNRSPNHRPAAVRAVSQEFTIVELTTLTSLPSVDIGPAHVAYGTSAADLRLLHPHPTITSLLAGGWLITDAGTNISSAVAAHQTAAKAAGSAA